jgi:hypothetical protein
MLSNFAFKFNLRLCIRAVLAAAVELAEATETRWIRMRLRNFCSARRKR